MEVLQEDIRSRGGDKDVVATGGDEDTDADGVNAVVAGHKDIRPGSIIETVVGTTGKYWLIY